MNVLFPGKIIMKFYKINEIEVKTGNNYGIHVIFTTINTVESTN